VESWPDDDGATPESPALLIWSEGDNLFPVSLAKRLQDRLGENTRLEIISHARHAPNLEHPERFNQLVLDFLKKKVPGNSNR